MPVLLSLCDCPFWILWLVPFLLGLFLGWFIWGVYRKYRAMYESSVKKNKQYKSKISNLETNLLSSKKEISSLNGDLAIANGRLKELEIKQNAAIESLSKRSESNFDPYKEKDTSKMVLDSQDAQFESDTSMDPIDPLYARGTKSDDIGDAISPSDDKTAIAHEGGLTQGDHSNTDNLHAGFQSGKESDSSYDNVEGSASRGQSLSKEEATQEAIVNAHQEDKYSKLDSSNLQIIEGIGPKMESLCKENGISDWTKLASKSPADLKGMLAKYGDRYRIIDPEIWPIQAIMARDKNWKGLVEYQKMVGGQRQTDSKLEKVMIKLGLMKQWKDNDLKAIEGIGPKIENLLQQNGISTWKALSESTQAQLNKILLTGGARYKLADPSTWASQAKLAAEGKFDELENYQNEI